MVQQQTVQKTIHLFGEMDLNLSLTRKQIVKEAARIAGLCGYSGGFNDLDDVLTINSSDYDQVKIIFDGPEDEDKVKKVIRSDDAGKNWETLDLKEGMFRVSPKTLQACNDKIGYGTQQKLPMSQGSMMNEIAKTYKIAAIRWGYHQDLIGLETKLQFLLWRDCGSHAEFLGLINKDGSASS